MNSEKTFFGKPSFSGIRLEPLHKSSAKTGKKKTSPKMQTKKLSPIPGSPDIEMKKVALSPHKPNIPKLGIPISIKEKSEIDELRELREQDTARKILMEEMKRRDMKDELYEKMNTYRERGRDRYNRQTNREIIERNQEKKHERKIFEKRKGISDLLTQPLKIQSRQFISDLDYFSKQTGKEISPNFKIRAKKEGLIHKLNQTEQEIDKLKDEIDILQKEREKKKPEGLTKSQQKHLFDEYASKQKQLLAFQNQRKLLETKIAKSPIQKKPETENPRNSRLLKKKKKEEKLEKGGKTRKRRKN